jgi:hypothetical protein
MKKSRDFRFVLRLAYKNIRFKKELLSLGGVAFLVLALLDWSQLAVVHQIVGVGGVIALLLFTAAILLIGFPLVVLWAHLEKDPEYIERLAATLPEYYNS